ncbi:MAG: DUF2207 domain-containing protein [Clostridiaceae bacterium]|nr:DUF2207 domain-containing protein [Clostridiaceae bacterium]
MRKWIEGSVIFLIICALLSTITAYCADDRSYYMSSFKVSAQLDSSGSMDVTEEITYEFDGSFRGVYRTLKTAGSDGMEAIEVHKIQDGRITQFVQNNSESENSYQLIDEGDGIRLKIFSTAEDEDRTFTIRYRVINVASKYNDIGELYWKFMGEDTDVKIENFELKITLPEGADKEQIKIFGHGPLSGVSEIIDSRNVSLRVEKLLPHNFVEARVLFPPSLVKDSKKIVEKDALEKIMYEEKGFADEANARRAKARAAVGFSFVYVLFELLMIVYLYFKYDKEYKAKFMGEYFRELPGNYSPAVLSVLWNFGKVKPRDITATMMDLVRRKYLKLIVEQTEIKGILKHKVENEYVFELNKEADLGALTPHEKYFIDWLIYTIGDGGKVSLTDIEQSSKTLSGAESFKSDYDAWVEYVKIEAEGLSFFERKTIKGQIIGVIIAVVGMIYGGFTAAVHNNIAGFIVLMIVSFILLIYSLVIRRRSRYGVEQFKMWKAFRKFLKHFSQLDKADLPAVILWEHYLVYAITLGVAKEVISQLRLVFREEDFNNTSLTYLYYGHYGHNYNYFDTIDNVTNTMMKTTESVYTQAMSKMASSTGGGGGFSGGGGGGGGGGGAGAF